MSAEEAVVVDAEGAAAGGGAAAALRFVVSSLFEQPINKRTETKKIIKRNGVKFFMTV